MQTLLTQSAGENTCLQDNALNMKDHLDLYRQYQSQQHHTSEKPNNSPTTTTPALCGDKYIQLGVTSL